MVCNRKTKPVNSIKEVIYLIAILFVVSCSLGACVSFFAQKGWVSNWWSIGPSLGIAVSWSMTVRTCQSSLTNAGLIFDILSTSIFISVMSFLTGHIGNGTILGLIFMTLGLLSIKYLD